MDSDLLISEIGECFKEFVEHGRSDASYALFRSSGACFCGCNSIRGVTLRGSGPILGSGNSGFGILSKLQPARLDRLNPPVDFGDLFSKLFGGSNGGFQLLLGELRALLCGRPPVFGRTRESFSPGRMFSRQPYGLPCLAEESAHVFDVPTVQHELNVRLSMSPQCCRRRG